MRANNVEGCVPAEMSSTVDTMFKPPSNRDFPSPSLCTTGLALAFAMTSVWSNHSIASQCGSCAVWLLVRQERKRVAGDDLTFLTLSFIISITTWSFIFLASSRRGKKMRRTVGISFVLLLTQSPAFRVSFLQSGDFLRLRVLLPRIYWSEKKNQVFL